MTVTDMSGAADTSSADQSIDSEHRSDGHGQSQFDETDLLAVEPYEVLENPVLKQEYRFLRRDTDEKGEYLHSEFRFQADAKSFGEHIHPDQEETLRVLEGEFEIVVDGDRQTLTVGEEATLPAGVPHYHGNVSGVETRVLHEIRPAMDFEEGLRMFSQLAQAGKTNANGENLLATAVFLAARPKQLYMASPSIRVQNLLLRALAPIGRLLGYQTHYPPAESPDN